MCMRCSKREEMGPTYGAQGEQLLGKAQNVHAGDALTTENGVRSFLGLAQGSVEARELSLQNGNVQEPCKLQHCTGLK